LLFRNIICANLCDSWQPILHLCQLPDSLVGLCDYYSLVASISRMGCWTKFASLVVVGCVLLVAPRLFESVGPTKPELGARSSPENIDVHGFKMPQFLHEKYPDFIDTLYGQGLDQRCFHKMPQDGVCLIGIPDDKCDLWFFRASQRSCRAQNTSRGLCPCHLKAISSVENVFLTAVFERKTLKTMIAFSRKNWTRRSADVDENMEGNETSSLSLAIHSPVSTESWALVDASSSEFCALSCMYGQRILRRKTAEVNVTIRHLLKSDKLVSHRESPQRSTLFVSHRWSCSALRSSSNVTDAEAITGVYYALDSAATSPGHAADMLLFGLGQYFAERLNEKNVPWLVPCSDNWEVEESVWIWTRFFLELNEVLRLPVRALDVHLLDVATFHTTHRFDQVHFATYYLGWNQACFKPVLARQLWPHVLQRFLNWEANVPSQKAKNTSVKRICLMKVLSASNNTASMGSPQRAFLFSSRFYTLMQGHNIAWVQPTIPLLERMWHINTAELIVTTWGSAMATTTALLMPRNDVDASLRLLVLIHPGYCLEASRLLKSRKKHCTNIAARGPSRMLRNAITIRDSALTDFVGGKMFCAKFVVVTSLRFVRPHDVEFRCN
jgi:hypothetical protein